MTKVRFGHDPRSDETRPSTSTGSAVRGCRARWSGVGARWVPGSAGLGVGRWPGSVVPGSVVPGSVVPGSVVPGSVVPELGGAGLGGAGAWRR